MRGEIEIWSGKDIIYEDHNLIVDGAGELIADIMTADSSYGGSTSTPLNGAGGNPISPEGDYSTSAFLDTSNYTIQAISFGKDASAFHLNAHALPTRRNLLPYSTFSGSTGNSIQIVRATVSSVPEISPPPKFINVPSSVAHVVALVDSVSSFAGYAQFARAESAANPWTVSGGQDNWFCRSVYVKYPVVSSVDFLDNDNLVTNLSKAIFNNIFLTLDLTAENWAGVFGNGSFQFSRNSASIRFDTTKNPSSPSGLEELYSNNNFHVRGADEGFSLEQWNSNIGCSYEGDDWYRIWVAGLAPASGLSGIRSFLTLGPLETKNNKFTGGVYTFGHQLELGRYPSELQFVVDNSNFTNWDLSGSVYNRDHSVGAVQDEGTVRVLGVPGELSYYPQNKLSHPPNPEITKLEDGDTSLFDSSSMLSGFSFGQNLNVIPFREASSDFQEYLNTLVFNRKNGEDQYTWLENYYDSVGLSVPSGLGSLGPQAYNIGCYPEGSSTGGTKWAIVSSLELSSGYAAPHQPLVSGVYNGIFNEASSMDASGFVTMIMSGSPDSLIGYTMSSLASGLCVSAGNLGTTDFGTVEYSLLIGSGDIGLANLYGGITTLGLWALDIKKSLQAGNTAPFPFDHLNNPRKYKLFAIKHLTKNLGYIKDFGGNAGATNYSDITIKWRLKFL